MSLQTLSLLALLARDADAAAPDPPAGPCTAGDADACLALAREARQRWLSALAAPERPAVRPQLLRDAAERWYRRACAAGNRQACAEAVGPSPTFDPNAPVAGPYVLLDSGLPIAITFQSLYYPDHGAWVRVPLPIAAGYGPPVPTADGLRLSGTVPGAAFLDIGPGGAGIRAVTPPTGATWSHVAAVPGDDRVIGSFYPPDEGRCLAVGTPGGDAAAALDLQCGPQLWRFALRDRWVVATFADHVLRAELRGGAVVRQERLDATLAPWTSAAIGRAGEVRFPGADRREMVWRANGSVVPADPGDPSFDVAAARTVRTVGDLDRLPDPPRWLRELTVDPVAPPLDPETPAFGQVRSDGASWSQPFTADPRVDPSGVHLCHIAVEGRDPVDLAGATVEEDPPAPRLREVVSLTPPAIDADGRVTAIGGEAFAPRILRLTLADGRTGVVSFAECPQRIAVGHDPVDRLLVLAPGGRPVPDARVSFPGSPFEASPRGDFTGDDGSIALYGFPAEQVDELEVDVGTPALTARTWVRRGDPRLSYADRTLTLALPVSSPVATPEPSGTLVLAGGADWPFDVLGGSVDAPQSDVPQGAWFIGSRVWKADLATGVTPAWTEIPSVRIPVVDAAGRPAPGEPYQVIRADGMPPIPADERGDAVIPPEWVDDRGSARVIPAVVPYDPVDADLAGTWVPRVEDGRPSPPTLTIAGPRRWTVARGPDPPLTATRIHGGLRARSGVSPDAHELVLLQADADDLVVLGAGVGEVVYTRAP